uniref:Beta-galactosidase n=1 Tax=Prolemur simus TaxID=1328070 RepID=A0A8C8YSX9_PROSS
MESSQVKGEVLIFLSLSHCRHVPWNLHEPRVDQFVFTGNLDLMAFITIASDVGLWVILCPGPYIGSDLDLGGLPSWLLKDPKMKLRTTYKGFTNAVNRYFDKLISRIVPLQYNQGGPIIAVQVENEYGSYYLDKKYMPYVKKVSAPLIFFHIYTLLFSLSRRFENPRRAIHSHTLFLFPLSSYLYAVLMKDVHEMFKLRFSLNFYMFHGGTNFGFMGGAASLNTYLPMVTSYDYGALLTEDGEYTPEYITFQEYFSSAVGATPFERWALGRGFWGSSVQPQPSPVKSAKPVSMEVLSVNQGNGQSYGYTLYETYISKGGILSSRGHVQDRAQDHHSLRILVENQGRLAYGKDINTQRKGLTGDIYLDSSPLRKFIIYSLDMNMRFIQRTIPRIWKPVSYQVKGPAFFLGFLKVGEPKDTFIKLEGWTKGVVFVNGQNLGRYWNLGPQKTLYLPGPWLHSGPNEIIVFEELKGGLTIQFTTMPFLGMAF